MLNLYLSKEYFCKMYPSCVSSKLCEFIFIDLDLEAFSFHFLDTQVSLAPTHVSPLVGWSVSHTFGFPISGQ